MRSLYNYFCLLVLTFGTFAHPPVEANDFAPLVSNEDFTTTIQMDNLFLFSQPDADYSSEYVKFIIFYQDGNPHQIYFQNSQKLKAHRDFLLKHKDYRGMRVPEMDRLSLINASRKVLFGTIRFRLATSGSGTMGSQYLTEYELISDQNNLIPIDHIIQAQEILMNVVSPDMVSSMTYSPTPKLREKERARMEELNQNDIQVSFPQNSDRPIVYTQGWTTGKIKIVKEADLEKLVKTNQIQENHILVMDKPPREIPSIAGLIVAEESSPSSHPALLLHMMGSVFYYQKNAHHSEKFKNLAKTGEPVLIKTYRNGQIRIIQKIRDQDIARLGAIKKVKVSRQPQVDRNEKQILNLGEYSEPVAHKIGAKAANMGFLLKHLGQQYVPDTPIAIPFYYYEKFLSESKSPSGESLQEFIYQRLVKLWPNQNDPSREDPLPPLSEVLESLKEIRNAMQDARVDPEMLKAIRSAIESRFGADAPFIRLRSSSSAEDIPDFNGAGLYTSKTVILSQEGHLEKRLKQVWKSVFTDRAYLTRRRFGVLDQDVSMAILVHPSIKGEIAQGVSIFSAEEGKQTIESIQITGFPGEEDEVTNPPPGKTPETTRVSNDGRTSSGEEKILVKKMVHSSEVSIGQNMLSEEQYRLIYELSRKIHRAWRQLPGKSLRSELDIEWDIAPVPGQVPAIGKVLITQVREVPALPTSVNKVEDTIIVGLETLSFRSSFGESSDSLRALVGNVKARIQSPGFVFDSRLSNEHPIENLELTTPIGKILNYSAQELQTSYQQSPWEKKTRWDGKKFFERLKTWTISIPYPQIPSLKLEIAVTEAKDTLGGPLRNPVRTFRNTFQHQDALFRFWADVNDIPPSNESGIFSPEVGDTESDQKIYWYAQAHDDFESTTGEPHPDLQLQYFEVKDTFDGREWQIQIDSKMSTTLMQKTMFLDIQKVSIVVDGMELEVSTPGSSVYAPAHHNFEFEFAIDLRLAKGVTAAQKQRLIEMGGPYLVIRGGSSPMLTGSRQVEATLWSSDWKPTKIGQWQNTTTRTEIEENPSGGEPGEEEPRGAADPCWVGYHEIEEEPLTYLTQIDSEDDFRALVRNEGRVNSVKFLLEIDSNQAWFQNTTKYQFHYPFLVAEIEKYKNLQSSEYESMILRPGSKLMTAGTLHFSKCDSKAFDGQKGEMLVYNIYFDKRVDLNEIMATYQRLVKTLPFIKGRLVYGFMNRLDHLRFNQQLKTRGIPSMVLEDLEKILPEPPRRDEEEADRPEERQIGKGEYRYVYHNHQWNALEFFAEDWSVRFDTPEGDRDNPKRNLNFGWRPKIGYNQFEYMHYGSHLFRDKQAVWADQYAQERPYSYYCQMVTHLLPEGQYSSAKPKQFLQNFGIDPNAEVCDLNIEVPPVIAERSPGYPVYRGDLLCMAQVDGSVPSVGKKTIVTYAPFAKREKPYPGVLPQWYSPAKKIHACLGQKKIELSESQGMTLDSSLLNTQPIRGSRPESLEEPLEPLAVGASPVASAPELPKLTCAEGQFPAQMALEVDAEPVDLKKVEEIQAGFTMQPRGTGNIRLDLCYSVDEETGVEKVEIKSLVYHNGSELEIVQVFRVGHDHLIRANGLAEIFYGEYTDFDVIFSHKDRPTSGVRVRGVTQEGEAPRSSLLAYPVQKNGQRWSTTSLQILVGDPVEGDPFGGTGCPLGHQPYEKGFRLGTAEFSIQACIFAGAGHTTGFEITSLTITDSNAKIPAQWRDQKITFDKGQLSKSFRYKYNHHNGCDSFFLEVPQTKARYGLTTAPLAGCGVPVKGAPKRNDGLSGFGKKAWYHTDYGVGEWSPVQKAEFSHFLF